MYDHDPPAACGLAPPAAADAARTAAHAAIAPTDGERLMRFYRHRDQAAFAEIVQSHAAMVWGVCSQILRQREDVEDAFQATFLILARKANSIRGADSAAGWLYRVAFRTALLARSRRSRRPETPLVDEPPSLVDQLAAVERSEQCLTLLEELHALPPQYREPLVLCYLEGRTRRQAAEELGVTSQTVKGRLSRGTRILRSRLVRRGVTLSATMGVISASMGAAHATIAPSLVAAMSSLAAAFAWKLGGAAQSTVAAQAAACSLAEKGLVAMSIAAAAKPALGLVAACLVAGSLTVATAEGPLASGGLGAVLLTAQAGAEADDDPAQAAEVAIEPASAQPAAEGQPPAAAAGPPPAAEPASAPAPPLGDVLVATPASADLVEVLIPAVGAPYPVQSPLRGATSITRADLPRGEETSLEMLKLEGEYWALKADALKTKARAAEKKAARLKEQTDSGMAAAPEDEILALEAEAGLLKAEVKLCELNAQRVREAREAAEAGALKSGDAGAEVSRLQSLLNGVKDDIPLPRPLDVDGDFGPLTEEAVKQFQKSRGLPPTGIADVRTLQALQAASRPMREDLVYPRGAIGVEYGPHRRAYLPPTPVRKPLPAAPAKVQPAKAVASQLEAALKAREAALQALQRRAQEIQAEADARKAAAAEQMQAQFDLFEAEKAALRQQLEAIRAQEEKLHEAEEATDGSR